MSWSWYSRSRASVSAVCETPTLTPSANSQFKAEFGWPPDAEFTWEQLQERVHREDREQLRAAVAAAIESGADLDADGARAVA